MCKITNIKNVVIVLAVLLFQIMACSTITYAAASPTISVTTPIAGGSYYEGTSISTSGTVKDVDSGNIITVYYRIDGTAGTAGTQVGSTITADGSEQAYSGTIPLDSTTLGAHILYLWSADSTARKSAETSRSFTVIAAPTLTITASTPDTTTASSVTYTFTFSESVTGFDTTQVTVTNGTKGTFSGSGATYTLVVTNTGSCTQTVTVNAVVNTVVANNANISESKTVTVDNTGPTVTVTANTADTTSASIVTYTFTFNETVIGFDSSDVIVTNGTKGTFTAVSGVVYTLVVTNSGNCTQTVTVNAGVCTDILGNTNTSGSKTVIIDSMAPPVLTVTANTEDTTTVKSITYTLTFSETVTGFDINDITVANGTKGTFTAVSGSVYTLVVTNSGSCIQTVTVNAGVCQNLNSINNLSTSKSITIVEPYNKPVLLTGMTPVIFDTSDFRNATAQEISDASWYSYRDDLDQDVTDRVANEKWANVKLADGSMFVWIPRYTYKISGDSTTTDNTDDKIEIKYSRGILDDTVGGTYKVHPAFNFGETPLKGIWVAKFEASNNGSGKVQVKPAVISWGSITVNAVFTACRAMETVGNPYGMIDTEVDTHMMKNSEWGAVAYLTEAIRDGDETQINSNASYYTGGVTTIAEVYGTNKEESSTGNEYGIYDLNGGKFEYVASYMASASTSLATYGASLTGVGTDEKYRDKIVMGDQGGYQANYDYVTNTLGESLVDGWALHETSTLGDNTLVNPFRGYGDQQYFTYSTVVFFVRGGNYSSTASGVFSFYRGSGSALDSYSFRPVLVSKPPAAPITTFSFDGVNINKLMSSDTTMEYSLDGGTVWTNCTDNIDLTSVISYITDTNDIKVRVSENASTPVGLVQTLNILAAPAAPTCSNAQSQVDKLMGLPISAVDLEGRVNGGLWMPLTVSNIGESTTLGGFNAGDTIDIRVRTTETTLCGILATRTAIDTDIAPIVVITANTPDKTTATSITYKFTFSDMVTGFDIEDVTVTNGTTGAFIGSGSTYTLAVTNSGNCTQTVTVNAGGYQNLSGVINNISGSKTIIIGEAYNQPVLVTGMTPLMFSISDFRDATAQEITDKTWYSYRADLNQDVTDRVANEKWANVKLLDGSMFVWIPRYTYKISGDETTTDNTDDKIEIKYSSGTTDDTVDGTYKVHPAFNFGDTQLTGIWVAKFEASNNGSSKVQVKPGVVTWGPPDIDASFTACRAMDTAVNIYGIINTDIDTHMMKNSEWGAVAYLTEAIRDGDEIGLNNDASDYTGGSSTISTVYGTNKEQSTTGNAYGIYDLNGGGYEYVASYLDNGNTALTTNGASLTGVGTDEKYRDKITMPEQGDAQLNYYYITSTLGESVVDGWAIHEITTMGDGTINPFRGYQDGQRFPYDASPFFTRSNSGSYIYPGLFTLNSASGSSANSFRPVLVSDLPAAPAAPAAPVTTFSFDGVNKNKLMSSDTTMEYSLDGGTVWTNCTANIDLTAVITNITATNDIKVRVKENAPTPAGEVQVIDILAGPAAPTFSNADSLLDKLIGLPISATNLEGRLNGGSWTLLTVSGTGESTSLGGFNTGDTIDTRVIAIGITIYGATATKIAIDIDITAPTVAVTANTSDTTIVSSTTYTFTFSETVTGFDTTDVTVTNGIKGTFTAVDGNTYTLVVTNSGACTQTVTVEAGVCIDVATNPNTSGSKVIIIVNVPMTKIQDMAAGSRIIFSDRQWIVIDQATGLLVSPKSISRKAFDVDNTQIYNPSDNNNIGYYLNNTYYNTFTAAQKAIIKDSTWNIGNESNETGSSVTTKIGLLRESEYNTAKTAGIFEAGGEYASWWLITPYSSNGTNVRIVSNNGTASSNGASSTSGLRPALRILETTYLYRDPFSGVYYYPQ
ncbi:MAG TPA: hypothetical protein DEP72_04855 [Clostridiales bacterium]|nr:hypothetical protein [Clostridiales bacterium]